MIEVSHLIRDYEMKNGFLHRKQELKRAVDDISFHIHKGEIFSLLGPNGAGKTTTIKILATLMAPTKGTCTIQGMDCYRDARKLRPHINFIFGGESGVYRRISGRENLRYFASLYGLSKQDTERRIDELLDLVSLHDAQHQKVEQYSKGMTQRLQIARGLINNPDVIFLDEPTIGLDPLGARQLRELIKALKQQGKTILLTTHYMAEAEELSDRIALLHHGKIKAMGSVDELKQRYADTSVLHLQLRFCDEPFLTAVKALPEIDYIHVEQQAAQVHLSLHIASQHIPKGLLSLLDNRQLISLQPQHITMEDVYLRLIREDDK